MTQEPKIFPYIAKLLNDEKVQYKTLGEVCDKIFAGGTPTSTKEEYYNGTIPWLRSGEINFNEIDKTEKTITELGFSKSSARWVRKNSVLLAMTGATVARSAVNNIKLTANQSVCALETNESIINYKYLYYCLANKYEALKNQGQGVLSSLNLTTIKKISIPLPPLSVQQEIVRILDKFTQLEAELDCRKRQYEYYRNALLSFGDLENRGGYNSLINNKIQYKTLGEVGTFIRGNGLQKKDLIESGVPAIHYGQIYTHYGVSTEQTISFVSSETAEKLKKVDYGDVIITNTSENLEDVGKAVAYYVKEQGVTGGHATIFKPSEKIIGKYLVYYTQTIEFSNQKRKYAKGTKVIDVSANDLAKISIPLPPIEEQERIVAILDKFDTLVNSISEGLPKEIQQRRQQYEYYREQLLTF